VIDARAVDRVAVRALDLALVAVHRPMRHAFAAMAHGLPASAADRPADSAFDRLRVLASDSGLDAIYGPRIDELRVERDAIFDQGDARRLANAARYGSATTEIANDAREGACITLATLATHLASTEVVSQGARPDAPFVADAPARLAAFARASGLSIRVVVEPSLVADAASGESTLFLAPRAFQEVDVIRLAAHEIAGHLVAAANAREQPLALLRVGTAGSWDDQEGLALTLEHAAGALDAARRRRLGARAVAALVYLEGGVAADARERLAALLVPEDVAAVAIRRAFRGGGHARDLAYLRGVVRVTCALEAGEVTVDELRMGRVSLEALGRLRELRGVARESVHRPSFAYSLFATFSGTSFETSPPSLAASLTRFDAT